VLRSVKMTMVVTGLLGAVLLAPTMANAAVLTPSDWLMRSHQASKQLNYRGTYVYSHNGRVESMRIIRRVDPDGGVRERLYSLDGAKREIIRENGRIWCYLPDRKIGVHEYRQVSSRQFPNILPQDIIALKRYYRMQIGKRDSRVANRDATQLLILPRDQFRYGFDLWADQKTGLLLSASLVDFSARSLEQYLFVSLVTGEDIPDQAFEPMTAKQDLKWFVGTSESSNQSLLAATTWSVGMLPPGFTLRQRIQRVTPLRQTRLEHQVYSDGLSATSVFIEDVLAEDKRQSSGLKSMGGINIFVRYIGNTRITVIGEVPARTVEMMAKSIRSRAS